MHLKYGAWAGIVTCMWFLYLSQGHSLIGFHQSTFQSTIEPNPWFTSLYFLDFYFGHLDIFMCCHTCSRRRYLSFIPHPVTMTPGQPRKIVVNIFPKDITTWPGQDSNPRPFGPESGVLTTRPRRPFKDWLIRFIWRLFQVKSTHVNGRCLYQCSYRLIKL